MYWAENGSTKTLKPSLSRMKSSSALLSSMTSEYLKPLHPPGCTATRRPPTSPLTFSASMNFLTSTTAAGVRERSISVSVELDIKSLHMTFESYGENQFRGSGTSRYRFLIRSSQCLLSRSHAGSNVCDQPGVFFLP